MEDYEVAYAIIRGETFEEIVFSSEEEAEAYCDERRNGASGDALDEMGCEDPEPEDEMEASFYAGMQGDYWHVETVHLTEKTMTTRSGSAEIHGRQERFARC